MGSQSTAKYSTLDVDVLDPAAASWAPSKFDGVHTQKTDIPGAHGHGQTGTRWWRAPDAAKHKL